MPPNKSQGSSWNTIRVSTDRVNLCQTHCKQVPDFSRAPRSGQMVELVELDQSQALFYSSKSKVNTIGFLQFLPTGQHGLGFGYLFQVCSLYVPFIDGLHLGVHFRGSLVVRLHSEIDQIHLSIEAQCGTARLPLGDCHSRWIGNGGEWG